MSLATQVSALATRIGTEVKALWSAVNTKAPSASPTFTGTVVLPSTTSIGTVSSTELGYVNGVTSAIQTQLNAKLASASYTAADVLTKVKTVDGTSSGLDADLLDGQHGTYYATAASVTAKPDLFVQATTPGSFGNLDFWLDTSATA